MCLIEFVTCTHFLLKSRFLAGPPERLILVIQNTFILILCYIWAFKIAGSEFQLKATFHDNIGNEFHAGPKDLKVKTSRCDLVKVSEGNEDATIWVYTKKAGTTMVKAWAEG